MNKMFHEVTRTWNPYVGCRHYCTYCYARELALGRLKTVPRYSDGFEPHLVESELHRRFKSGLIFVSSMGDLWGWGSRGEIEKVLEVVRNSPTASFLFLTKNPARYHEFLGIMPPNVVLGATIESNQEHLVSFAPLVRQRYEAMRDRDLDGFLRFVSIEPIMKCDLADFIYWVADIRPHFVYVGYDNHGHNLKEPTPIEAIKLIAALRVFTEVRTKTLRDVTETSVRDGSAMVEHESYKFEVTGSNPVRPTVHRRGDV